MTKLSQYTSCRHIRGVEILNLGTIRKKVVNVTSPGTFTTGTHSTEGGVGSRVNLDNFWWKKTSCPRLKSDHESSAFQSFAWTYQMSYHDPQKWQGAEEYCTVSISVIVTVHWTLLLWSLEEELDGQDINEVREMRKCEGYSIYGKPRHRQRIILKCVSETE